MTTVHPVAASKSCAWPILIPSISVIAISFMGFPITVIDDCRLMIVGAQNKSRFIADD
jgi:hypothetical protein